MVDRLGQFKKNIRGDFSHIFLQSSPLADYRCINRETIRNRVSTIAIEHTAAEHAYLGLAIAIPVTNHRNVPGYSMLEEYVSCTIIVVIQQPYAIPEYTGPDR